MPTKESAKLLARREDSLQKIRDLVEKRDRTRALGPEHRSLAAYHQRQLAAQQRRLGRIEMEIDAGGSS